MARIRSIKPEFWRHPQLGRLTPLARLTFIGLVSLADDEGRGRANTDQLWGELHGESGPNTRRWWADALKELRRVRDDRGPLIHFYKVAGAEYYWIPGFCRQQRIDEPSKSRLPPPPNPNGSGGDSLATPRGSRGDSVPTPRGRRVESDGDGGLIRSARGGTGENSGKPPGSLPDDSSLEGIREQGGDQGEEGEGIPGIAPPSATPPDDQEDEVIRILKDRKVIGSTGQFRNHAAGWIASRGLKATTSILLENAIAGLDIFDVAKIYFKPSSKPKPPPASCDRCKGTGSYTTIEYSPSSGKDMPKTRACDHKAVAP